jgi:hypothetical protein
MPNKEQYKKLKDAGVFYTQAYKIKKKESDKKYSINNSEKIKIKKQLYYQKIKNTKHYKEQSKIWCRNYGQTPKRKAYLKKYRLKNKERNRERRILYYKNNPNKYEEKKLKQNQQQKIYAKQNREKINLYIRNKRKITPTWIIRDRVRSRVYQVLIKRNVKKCNSTLNLLGIDNINILKNHLEKQFKKDMTWDNYGLWHIDHIKPCASFDLVCPVQQLSCFHYKNLQPLWASENMSKGSKLIDTSK